LAINAFGQYGGGGGRPPSESATGCTKAPQQIEVRIKSRTVVGLQQVHIKSKAYNKYTTFWHVRM